MANKLILTIILFCLPAFAFEVVSTIKEAGDDTILLLLDAKGGASYPAKYHGSSAHAGPDSNKLSMDLSDGENPALAIAILAAVEKPTCTASVLTITTDFGTYIVADSTVIVADPTDTKFVKTVLSLDVSDNFQVESLEKTTGVYGLPVGSSPVDLKEFSVPAAGSTLTEVQNFIK